jgi:hypothetical protein
MFAVRSYHYDAVGNLLNWNNVIYKITTRGYDLMMESTPATIYLSGPNWNVNDGDRIRPVCD